VSFFHIKKHYFDNALDEDKHLNVLYGLGQNFRSVREITANSLYEMQGKVNYDDNEEQEDDVDSQSSNSQESIS